MLDFRFSGFLQYKEDGVQGRAVRRIWFSLKLPTQPTLSLAATRNRSTSRIGGRPKNLLYSRLK
jgi:hypothetical protein